MGSVDDGLGYIRDRYGDVPDPEPGWYDRGGSLPSAVYTLTNDTGEPVPVYTEASGVLSLAAPDERSELRPLPPRR